MLDFGANLCRLMARQGVTQQEVADRTGLDLRTIRGLLRGGPQRPHARTLQRLADGLGVAVDELFENAGTLAHRRFDRRSNPLVDEVVAEQPGLFAAWSEEDFDALYGRFGTGGALTREGVLVAAHDLAARREVRRQVELLLETGEAELLKALVNVMYCRVVLHEDLPAACTEKGAA